MHKGTNFKAIHNSQRCVQGVLRVVFQCTKVQILKQFTTNSGKGRRRRMVNALVKLEQALLPVGTVIMWTGSTSQVPCGWQIMAEMRDRFPVGTGLNYNVGTTGGENTHTLTIAEIPNHSHSLFLVGSGTRFTGSGDANELNSSNGSTVDTGGGAAHENRPPYYSIYFIEKVSLCLQ